MIIKTIINKLYIFIYLSLVTLTVDLLKKGMVEKKGVGARRR